MPVGKPLNESSSHLLCSKFLVAVCRRCFVMHHVAAKLKMSVAVVAAAVARFCQTHSVATVISQSVD
jgi:hypothetical protein